MDSDILAMAFYFFEKEEHLIQTGKPQIICIFSGWDGNGVLVFF